MASITRRDHMQVRPAPTTGLGAITMCGFQSSSRGLMSRPLRVFGRYAVVYLVSGSGVYEDERGCNQSIRPGDLIFVFPELGHRYGPGPSESWSEFYLVFEGPVFDLWRQQGLLDPARPVLHAEPVDHWLRALENVVGGTRLLEAAPPLLEVCRLQQVLAELHSGATQPMTDPAEQRWAARACALLEAELSKPLVLEQVAGQLGLPADSFRKRFTRRLGVTPGRYRAQRVMERACLLMQQGRLTDKQIARELGFCDEFHFSRRFKQLMGASPRVFRRQLPVVG